MTIRMIRPVRAVMASTVMVLALAALAGCSFQDREKVWEIAGPVFGTAYHIKVVLPDDPQRLENLSSGIEKTLEQVDASMSTWREDSELSSFNRQDDQSDWVPVSRNLYRVLERSLEISEMTGGAFDITVGPLVNLWGFGPDGRPQDTPPDEKLEEVLTRTGYQNLSLRENPPAVKAEPVQYLDLSAIAKGFGVDQVAEYLENEGVSAYLVEIGGEIRVNGRKPDDTAWRLAVEQPTAEGRQVNRIVALHKAAMATSGDYRNYYESQGQRYSHTIDPVTGKPITHSLASVSVITDDCMTADALATAFNVMGFERANALAVKENLAVYFIVRRGDGFETHATPAFLSYIVD
ncbi:MAG: FAD:protein FMN transferase [Marinobacter sp.]|nr:FAD:protein FMN transferase [Marinobacter sp.]MBC7191922.1 FAD:protein FMN transferase [Marinobacter sp.]